MVQTNSHYSKRRGIEKYIKDTFKRDVYIKLNKYEIYAFDFTKKREILARDENNNEFYCKRNDNEIYPIFLDTGFQKLAVENGSQIYAIDKFGNEKYPLNRYRKEKLAKKHINSNTTIYYASYANNEQFYPKDDMRNEWIHTENGNYLLALTHDSKPKVPILKNGKINYAKKNNKEVLYQYKHKPFFGKDTSGNEIYPLDENNDEYYPNYNSTPMIAKNSDGKYKYALSHLQKIIYPQDQLKDEHYIENFVGNKSECVLEEQADFFDRYILSNEYPTKENSNGLITEILINNNLLNKYPLDSNKNEFTTESGCILATLGYPITHDNFIILPNVNNKPITLPNDKHLLKHVKYLLYRPIFNTYDFLTDVQSKRKSNIPGSYTYTSLKLSDYKIEKSKMDYYIIGSLVFLISFLLLFIFC